MKGQSKATVVTTKKKKRARMAHEAEGAGSGAVAGAVFGSFAGPPGMLAGAVLGGAVGAVAAAILDSEDSKHSQRDRELDAEIGVSEGEMGAPNLEHPPATTGAFSSASAGGENGERPSEPAEGPMQTP